MATENQHQTALFKWSRQPKIRAAFPELKMLFHIKNETREGAAQVAVDRAMGVKKGVPDLCLPVARGKYHALYIEMKTEKGRTTKEQEWWLEALREAGSCACLCRGWEVAAQVLTWYLSLPEKGEQDGISL